MGSGKSSLLSALLGEMPKMAGRVRVEGRVAYVPQQAWIANATVKENIVFGRPHDETAYHKVVRAAELLPDFAIFPAVRLGESL